MKDLQKKPNVRMILEGLKDFQRETVDYVYRRLYTDKDLVNRFLIADEVGLGKTLVARGVIAKAVNSLWKKEDRIDIVYICANSDIARQNINRLNITGERELAIASRMTLLPLHLHNLKGRKINFVSFTPGTSFDLRSRAGIAYERVLLYHILREGWKFGNIAGPKNFFQCDVGYRAWRDQLKRFNLKDIDRDLKKKFLAALKKEPGIRREFRILIKEFAHFKKRLPVKLRSEQRRLIGDIRRILAQSCVNALEPDIVILDEFQRFKTLLEGNDEMARLANALFDFPNAKVILLSATPYKMFTMHHEEDEDHYTDFIKTIKFLLTFNEKETENFTDDLMRYRKGLYQVHGINSEMLSKAKGEIENRLSKIMVRTERLAVTKDRNGMISDAADEYTKLSIDDLNSFAFVDNIARSLDTGDVFDYWKSAPYLLNMMDKDRYKLKRKFVERAEKDEVDELLSLIEAGEKFLLSWKTVRNYKSVDPMNARLTLLISNMVQSGLWKLLWLPPSLPYYEVTKSLFFNNGISSATKALVFSSWNVVPKVIAMLCSYAAERHIIKNFEKDVAYSELTRKRSPLLQFTFSEGRHTGMSNFTYLYPCLTLAKNIDPFEICSRVSSHDKLADVDRVKRLISEDINRLIQPIIKKYSKATKRSDDRWYWALPVLLDRHHNWAPLKRFFEKSFEDSGWRNMVRQRSGSEEETRFSEHIDILEELIADKVKLGRPPDDLLEVITKITLASPAIISLRSIMRHCAQPINRKVLTSILNASARISLGFRSLFNLPNSIIMIRSLRNIEDSRYWESVLDYCIDGNLQSVMDEYIHVLYESLGLIDTPLDIAVKELSERVYDALSLRTINLEFDEIKRDEKNSKITLGKRSLRCKFALRFGDGKNDDGSETRAEHVRNGFNSPFMPFILASTSIGQEGLDFHHYCHDIYHWNLPSNPVDLEQREGRIHRYKGHVIRRNIAKTFPLYTLDNGASKLEDPWKILFKKACDTRPNKCNDLVPYWIYEIENGYKIRRHIPLFPLSREYDRRESLINQLVAYRMVFGQPRQEDLVKFLCAKLNNDADLKELSRYQVDLSPR